MDSEEARALKIFGDGRRCRCGHLSIYHHDLSETLFGQEPTERMVCLYCGCYEFKVMNNLEWLNWQCEKEKKSSI